MSAQLGGTPERNFLSQPLLSPLNSAASPADGVLRPTQPQAVPPTPLSSNVAASAVNHEKQATPTQMRARKTLRRWITAAMSHRRASQTHDPGRPSLKAAEEYMRFYLPKTDDGKLLPITCSSAEFAAHVGSGVAIYMHFVKMTGWMFFVATIISLPQFAANLAGSQLKLEWPVNNQDCANSGGLMGLVSVVMQGLGYVFYSCLLGNVDFSVTQGIPHLASEMLLSMMFCVYVYWIWWYNNQVLTEIEANRTRASDFAVLVSRLPPLGSDPESLRQHFSFFGPVASVAVSTDRHALLGALQRHRQLKARWRHLHLECHRSLKALRASSHHAGGVQLRPESRTLRRQHDKLLLTIERHWAELLRSRAELLRAANTPSVCTGHAIVLFKSRSDAQRCVRHFELIRRHERSRDGVSAYSLDFRQLYFRVSHKLEVARAPEPSDVLWQNLRCSRTQVRTQNFKTTLSIFAISCVSTFLITETTISATMNSKGLLTTLWATPVVIVSNVVIFVGTANLAIFVERHHTRSSQHMHMLFKMIFFQLFNTVVAALCFMFRPWEKPTAAQRTCPLTHPPLSPKDNVCFSPSLAYLDFDFACVQHWYTTGAVVLVNAVVGDLTAILGLIEFIRPDKLIVRYLIAPRCHSQAEMNQVYALDSELYLPFRYQLVLKMVCIAMTFCSAVPLLLPIATLFMFFSYWIDRYNLLRVFKPPPRTTDRTITMSVLYILPLAAFGHIFFALFFYSKQADQPVPVVYYALLIIIMAIVMTRVTSELSAQSQRPIKDPDTNKQFFGDEELDVVADEYANANGAGVGGMGGGMGSGMGDDLMGGGIVGGAIGGGGIGGGTGTAGVGVDSLRAHLDEIELYVPPLSAHLLNDWHATVAQRDPSERRSQTAGSTRATALSALEP